MPKSQRQCIIDGFLALGWVEEKCRSRKYVQFGHPESSNKFLVGKSASMRLLPDGGPIAKSISMTESKYRKAVMYIGQHASSLTSVDQARLMFLDWLKKGGKVT